MRGRRRRDRDVPEGQREFAFDEPCAGGGPVLGGEFEVSVARPVRHDADDLREVGLDVERVEPSRFVTA